MRRIAEANTPPWRGIWSALACVVCALVRVGNGTEAPATTDLQRSGGAAAREAHDVLDGAQMRRWLARPRGERGLPTK